MLLHELILIFKCKPFLVGVRILDEQIGCQQSLFLYKKRRGIAVVPTHTKITNEAKFLLKWLYAQYTGAFSKSVHLPVIECAPELTTDIV